VAEKAESQEICFVGKRSYADFVAARRPDVTRPGEIVATTGEALGAHQGLVHHTVGQRRGLGIAAGEPLFVIRLEPDRNRLVVGSREEAAAREIALERVSITSGRWPGAPFGAEAMVRYRGALAAAVVEPGSAGSAAARVRFSGAGPIASPGQALVFYRGDEVLGGGTISGVETASSREVESEVVSGELALIPQPATQRVPGSSKTGEGGFPPPSEATPIPPEAAQPPPPPERSGTPSVARHDS
jgi:tRNA-specific 2-thiouridylase